MSKNTTTTETLALYKSLPTYGCRTYTLWGLPGNLPGVATPVHMSRCDRKDLADN